MRPIAAARSPATSVQRLPREPWAGCPSAVAGVYPAQPRESSLSFRSLLGLNLLPLHSVQFPMPDDYLNSVAPAQALRHLFCEIHRAVLPTRAPERHHQILKTALLIIGHTRVDQRHHAGEKLMHTLLLVEIFHHGGVFAGERLETLFPPGIRQA